MRDEAAQAAEAINNTAKTPEERAIFDLALKDVGGVRHVVELSGPPALTDSEMWSHPFILNGWE